MADRITPEQRHLNMSAIHSRNTKPEIIVRRFLWSNGYRYRLNHHRLPGKPDIVLRSYRTCIFINGCFWHGHNVDFKAQTLESSNCCKIPKTNTEFWTAKIKRNQERDDEVLQKLKQMGWNTIVLWECQLKPAYREQTLRSLDYTLCKAYLASHKELSIFK